MILHYYGITTDTPDTMMKAFFERKDFVNPRNSTEKYTNDFRHEKDYLYVNEKENKYIFLGPNRLQVWDILKQFADKNYKIPEKYVKQGTLNLSEVKVQISKGNPVMFSYGAVEGGTSGHIAVIRGFTEGGHIIINDPWGDVATPEGFLLEGNKGRYYDKNADNKYDYNELGNGDNCVLREDELKKVIKQPNLHQTLHIEYPHIWSFPFKTTLSNNRERRHMFSTHTIMNETNQKEFREYQIKEMLEMEVIEDAGYPISADRFWHDGIHIEGNKPVYAVGYGRLVAARIQSEKKMPLGGDNNFVLVRHQVNINNQIREFYSHYMHLKPVDINDRIKRQITGIDPAREKDWIDQLIEHIKPKCAIVLNDTITSRKNNQGVLVPTNEKLFESSIIYLYPTDQNVRAQIEKITPEEELRQNDMLWFYNAVNNDNFYKAINGSYYAYYHKSLGEAEIRYVGVDKVIPQIVNVPEFMYYRNILAKLINGEITTFCGEKVNRIETNKEESKDIFKSNLKKYFPIMASSILIRNSNITGWNEIINAMYNDIKRYYTDNIKRIKQEPNNGNKMEKEMMSLTWSICKFGKSLLVYPEKMLKNSKEVFTLCDKWYEELIKVYCEILKEAGFDNSEINDYVNCVNKQLLNSRANIDYHIEVNGNTMLGMPGKYGNRNSIIHFEIFSDVGLITNSISNWEQGRKQFVKVPEQRGNDDYYNVPKIIESLRSVNFLREPYFTYSRDGEIRETELRDYLLNKENSALQYAIVQHLHSHALMDRSAWEQIIRKGRGFFDSVLFSTHMNEFLAYKWFSKEMIEELKPLTGTNFNNRTGPCAVFYHPVRFLAWLDMMLVNSK